MMRDAGIERFEAGAVFHGLLDGAGFQNRVAGACVYRCPRCRHGIRFRWRSFYQAETNAAFKGMLRRLFDELTPSQPADEQACLDFFCPVCAAPTRIIYCARDYTRIAYHFDIQAALVGAEKPRE